MSIIPPINPVNLGDYPAPRAYSQIQPFTQSDGATYLETLENLRYWILTYLIPHVDTEIAALAVSWLQDIAAVQTNVAGQLTAQNAALDTRLATAQANFDSAVQQVITAQIVITDPIFKGIIANAASQTRVLLNSLYLSDSAEGMQGKALHVRGDSFTQVIGGQTPAASLIQADKAMTLTNAGV